MADETAGGVPVRDDDTGEEIVVYEPSEGAPLNLFGAQSPAEVLERSVEVAELLSGIIEQRGLYAAIGQKRHVLVEGWTLLGSMMGVFPVVVWTRKLDNGWEARVEARTRDGGVVGAAEAECLRSESRWEKRDDYALRSMAQTRATSKALRGPLGFIVQLAGFNPTPEAEVPAEAATQPSSEPSGVTKAQHAKIGVLIKQLKEKSGEGADWVDWSRHWVNEQFGKHSRAELTSGEASLLIAQLQQQLETAETPFG